MTRRDQGATPPKPIAAQRENMRLPGEGFVGRTFANAAGGEMLKYPRSKGQTMTIDRHPDQQQHDLYTLRGPGHGCRKLMPRGGSRFIPSATSRLRSFKKRFPML